MAAAQQTPIDVDSLARGKLQEIEEQLESQDCNKPDFIDSRLAILKQIITSADLHRTNDKDNKLEETDAKHSNSGSGGTGCGESIYADYNDDNEQFNAVDLTEQFATNSVKWTIRVHAFRIVRRLIRMSSQGKIHSRSNTTTSHQRALILKHLPDLIRLSFVAATSPYDDLKMQGFEMFKFIINKFAAVEEREFPGHSILEQYKTQVLSAIKPAFNLDAPPYITAIASQVCSLWICRGLEKDFSYLRRTYQLMLMSIEKLDKQSVNQHNKLYTESELEQERVDILSSWAQLYMTSKEIELYGLLTKADCARLYDLVKPQVESLIDKWWEALKDYALLIMPAPRFIGVSHDSEHVYTREVALRLFEPTWAKIILASTIWLCNEELKSIDSPPKSVAISGNDCESNCDNSPRSQERTNKPKYLKFICGIIMKEFCRCQVDKSDPEAPLNESTLLAIKSLHMLASDEQLRAVMVENLTLAQEFYTILYNITVVHCRDPNRATLRTTLDLLFKIILPEMRSKESLHYGLARLINHLMRALKDIEIACKQSSSDLDAHKMCLSIKLNNLLVLIKQAPDEIMDETQLREATIILFQEMLRFKPEPAVSVSLVDQLRDLYSVLSAPHRSYFINTLFEEKTKQVAELLSAIYIEESRDRYKALLLTLETILKSLKSALDYSDGEDRMMLINRYVSLFLDAIQKLEEESKTNIPKRREDIFEYCLSNIKIIQRSLAKEFDDLEVDLRERFERALTMKKEVKSKTESKEKVQSPVKAAGRAGPARPQAAKITLKADFSNFYAKKS